MVALLSLMICAMPGRDLCLLFAPRGLFLMSQKRIELHARSWGAMPGRRAELQFLLLSGEWGKHLPQCCTLLSPYMLR